MALLAKGCRQILLKLTEGQMRESVLWSPILFIICLSSTGFAETSGNSRPGRSETVINCVDAGDSANPDQFIQDWIKSSEERNFFSGISIKSSYQALIVISEFSSAKDYIQIAKEMRLATTSILSQRLVEIKMLPEGKSACAIFVGQSAPKFMLGDYGWYPSDY